MKKSVIVINGHGGAGKDTLCGFAAKKYKTVNVSSIDPISAIARQAGWNGKKDNRARKFLSDLKQLTVEFNDLPTKYLCEEYRKFINSDNELMFVHIRESDQITHFLDSIDGEAVTLLIRRGNAAYFGNASDDNVENYNYDFTYYNNLPLEQAENDFLNFLSDILK